MDKNHDWKSLIDPAYELLAASGKENLDKNSTVGLPPDWLEINKQNGFLRPAEIEGLTTNYSFDAMRVPWRISLDYEWNKEEKAFNYLSNYFGKLAEFYGQNGKISTSYAHDGTIVKEIENPAMYATSLGYFKVVNPALAQKIYQEKIINLYSNDANSFKEDLPYYEQNWLWFGAALYNNQLVKY